MYNVKNDKRSITSANKIAGALVELGKEKSFEDITITQLQERSGVSRSTFYRIFSNLDDVITYRIESGMSQFLKTKITGTEGPIEFLVKGMMFYIITFPSLVNIERVSTLIKYFGLYIEKYNAMMNREIKFIGNDHSYYMVFGAVFAAIMVWDKRGQKESVEELVSSIKESIKKIDHVINF